MRLETLLTPEVMAMKGVQGEPLTAPNEVCRSEIRRWVVATMDDNPLWYDEEYARATRFGLGCAPPVYTIRATSRWRWPMGTPDPVRNLSADGNPRLGETEAEEGTLKVPAPQGFGHFYGGGEVEVFQLARLGDVITSKTSITDIIEKTGRSGKLLVVFMDSVFTNQTGEVLCISHQWALKRKMKGKAWT